MQLKNLPVNAFRSIGLAVGSLAVCSALSGCLLPGFSNGGGDGSLLIPGGIGLLVLLGLLLWLVCRHRW